MDALDRAEQYLADAGLLDKPGAVLYSGAETLQPGPVYLMGLNPGGGEASTLRDSIASCRTGNNCYLDEEWAPGGHVQPKGQSTLQRRVQDLCGLMGLQTRSVPASNLVFTRSRRVDAHGGFVSEIETCLPVHGFFLEAIKPDMIVTFGNLGTFAKAFSLEQKESRLADHGSWQAHRGVAELKGTSYRFANIPHMSLWASDSRHHVLRWALGKD